MDQRFTAQQVSSMLGLTDEQLRMELRNRRDQLPARDPKYPDLFTQEFVDALRGVLNEAKAAQNKGKDGNAIIFSVTSGKGGVGKTSLAVNIATEFARRGYRTILVDTDLGLANTHILSGVQPSNTLSDYLEGSVELADRKQ